MTVVAGIELGVSSVGVSIVDSGRGRLATAVAATAPDRT
jgi:hypothetical protein